MVRIINTLYYVSGALLFGLLFSCIISLVLQMLNLITILFFIKIIFTFALHLVFIQVPLLLIIRYLERKHGNN
jgi:hypothetical protein